jgi:Cu+-exporting ATPase
MKTAKTTLTNQCYHCGDPCGKNPVEYDEKEFCCQGCKTVYNIFRENDLENFYALQAAAGSTPKEVAGKYDYLLTDAIAKKLLSYKSDTLHIINLYIPPIHCSSCIWLLENLDKLAKGILQSEVDFPKKTVRISYHPNEINLHELVLLLTKIGYEPYISLEDSQEKKPPIDRSLWYQLGVAGFAFGNIMFLSFPEYFETSEFWLDQYKSWFRGLTFLFSIPVITYAAKDYFKSAYKGIQAKHLNIDVPIALGITVLFLRSSIDILMDWGPGFFDSLSGLVFFLLLGKYFQQKTYNHLSFERDYTAYFPIATTKIHPDGTESHRPIHQIKKGDVLLIRHQEIIPVDGVIHQGHAAIDYSYVSGESKAVEKFVGDTVYAGGKQTGTAIEIIATKNVSQSYLTQLWSHAAFKGQDKLPFQNFNDRISRRFTKAILTIAVVAGATWLLIDPSESLHVFTAVLIVACPCALALAAPFTLGNMLRIYGKLGLYLKDIHVIEKMANIQTVIFDKTGTLTATKHSEIEYRGAPLTPIDKKLLKNSFRNANHPLSRAIYDWLPEVTNQIPLEFHETLGKGIYSRFAQHAIHAGAASFVYYELNETDQKKYSEGFLMDNPSNTTGKTMVHLSINGHYKGVFYFKTPYRKGVKKLVQRWTDSMELYVFSGDQDHEKQALIQMGFKADQLFFNQKPEEKLKRTEALQETGATVMMVGDGLNDAGALAKSDVGLALSEDIAVFTPACDGILEANKLLQLDQYSAAAKKAMRVIQWSLYGSLCYNLIGIGFAVSGQLEPVVAAILMPLSAISVVGFTTAATNRIGRRLRNNKH